MNRAGEEMGREEMKKTSAGRGGAPETAGE